MVFVFRTVVRHLGISGPPPSCSPYESRMLTVINKCSVEIRLECSRFEIDLCRRVLYGIHTIGLRTCSWIRFNLRPGRTLAVLK